MMSEWADKLLRVLLVEDDEDDYFLVREMLSDCALRVDLTWVTKEADALAELSRCAYDVCLLDFRLGRETGLDVLRAMKAKNFPVPVIFLSGQAGREVDMEAMQAGAADFVPKDALDPALLERTLRYAVAQQALEDSLRRSRDELEIRVEERTAALKATNDALAVEVEQRKKIEEALRESDARKDEFLAVLGHELRNPLAVISSGLQVLERGIAEPSEILPMMSRQMAQFTRLIDDLLDVSRISRGKLDLQKSLHVLDDIIHQAVRVVEPLYRERQINLELNLQTNGVRLEVDATRVEQVLVNLLNNAAKYSDKGGRVRLTSRLEGSEVALEIKDNGIGISPELQARVFELFIQEASVRTRSRGGLGIGLSLVKQLVELHGGKVAVTSEGVGRGTSVRFSLPIGDLTPVQGTTTPCATGGRTLSVLIADDNEDLANTLAMRLRQEGHRVRLAHDGRAGLEAASRELPQVALFDVGLPDMSGHDLAREVRKLPGSPLLIAISGFGQPRDREQSLAAGFDEHWVKPLDVSRLLARLQQEPLRDATPDKTQPAEPPRVKRRVLIVDDQHDTLLVGEAMLRHFGFEVHTAQDIDSALSKSREVLPDIVVSDLKLSARFDGYELAKKIRADRQLSEIVLVATSGYGGADFEAASLEAGFDFHLTKPIDYRQLVSRLSELASQSASS